MPFLFVLILLVGVVIGMQVTQIQGAKPSLFASRSEGRLDEILNHIDWNYVDTIDTRELMDELVAEYLDREDVIEEIFNKLDPHSNFIPASTFEAESENLAGNFQGIGIEFNIIRDTIQVVSPISGGPSERLGVKSGDKIIMVDDSLVAGVGIGNDGVVGLLRGPKGSEGTSEVQRQGSEELIPFSIERDNIPLFSLDVAYMVDEEVGYLKLNRFSAKTTQEFRKGLQELTEAGAERLILDLRGNPGGYLMAATNVADEFLSGRKMIVYTEGKAKMRDEYKARIPGLFEQGEMVILIDEGSASASEIVAGALQDHERALVVGRRSFGKGLVQEIYSLGDSSAIRLTVARYYTPDGRCIQRAYDNGVEAYYDDYLERLRNGGVVPDSIKEAINYGIVPDVVVVPDTSESQLAFNQLYNSGLITSFAYEQYAKDPSYFDQWESPMDFRDNFELPEEGWETFRKDFASKLFMEEALLEEIRAQAETAIAAQFARQHWKNDGFFPVFHELDDEFQRAYELVKEGRKLNFEQL